MDFFQMFLSGLISTLVVVLVFLVIKLAAMSGCLGSTARFLLGNNYDYNEVAEAEVSSLLDKIDSSEITASLGKHTITAGNKSIWVGNFPYAYGHITDKDARVSLKTFKRVRKLHIELASK